jgi:methyl-accepting chemotaxis protein
MDVSLTINDLFKIALYVVGIGALGYLIVVLKNVSKLVAEITGIVKENEESINETIKEVPGISENINSITKNANIAIKEMTPDINGIVKNANNITNKIGSLTDTAEQTAMKALDTADITVDAIADAAYSLKFNVKNINDYIKIIGDVIERVKEIIKNR